MKTGITETSKCEPNISLDFRDEFLIVSIGTLPFNPIMDATTHRDGSSGKCGIMAVRP